MRDLIYLGMCLVIIATMLPIALLLVIFGVINLAWEG